MTPPSSPGRRTLGRRALLGGAGAAVVGGTAVALGVATGETSTRAPSPRGFAGRHQAGIEEPAAAFGLMAAFDVVAPDRPGLAEALRRFTAEARLLVDGRDGAPEEARDPALPPLATGVVDATAADSRLAITVGVGATLFDDRFGLAARRPRELVTMPFLANDRLDPARSHGDLLVTLSGSRPEVLLHGLRQLMRATRRSLVLRWTLDGFNRPDARPVAGRTDSRNLLGFRDGTANLDASSRALLDEHVWVGPDRGEPEWAVGGTYQAVRVLRMFVEHWDRTSLVEQERVIGRRKVSGAPLDGERETDPPDYAADPDGRRTPLDAHIRLANPRTPDTASSLLLRRGFSYSAGMDRAGQLDHGLAFVSYQASLGQGFLAVQARLKGEPLEEYVLPVGGGFFYVLPGVTSADGSLGDRLLA